MNKNPFERRQYKEAYQQAINELFSLSALDIDTKNMLIRVNTQNIPKNPETPAYFNHDDIDTFVIITSANPLDLMTYTSPINAVNLNVRDGGFF